MDAFPPANEPVDPVIGGILVQLTDDPVERTEAEATLRAHPALTVGTRSGPWLTLAAEAVNAAAARDLHSWIATVRGVRWLEVSAVFFEGLDPQTTPTFPTPQAQPV